MSKELIKILKSVKLTTGIDTAAYSADGALLFRTADFPSCDFSYSREEKDICQAGGSVTVLPLKSGATVILSGTGDIYRNYAALLRAVIEEGPEPKKELTLAEKLRLYLAGKADEETINELREKYAGPFDCYVLTLVAESAHKRNELKNYLDTMHEVGDLVVPYDDTSVVFIKKCGGEDEYQSATDFAITLGDSVREELRINFVINVGGTVHAFSELSACFERCALAYAFGRMLSPDGKVYSYKEYVMTQMLSEIPVKSLKEYLGTLLDRDSAYILDDEELMLTAEEFLKNSLNISETSRSMYMHRNTLIYRLDKIEKATGLNLRHFNDAVAFRLLTVLNKLIKNKQNGEKHGL